MTFADYLTVEWAPGDSPFEASPTWVDITARVTSIRTSSGARSTEDLYGAGTCTIEVNNKRPGQTLFLDPDVWYRYRQIRIYTTVATGERVFQGWVKSVTHDPNRGPLLWTARIDCVDALGLIADFAGDGDYETFIGTAPTDIVDGTDGYKTESGAQSVLEWVLAATPSLSLNANRTSIAPMFIAAKQAGSGLSMVQDFLEAERGQIASTPGFEVTLMGRYYRMSFVAPSYTADAELTDVPAGTYRYLRGSLELAAPDESYYDMAVVGGKGIDPQSSSDVPSGWPATAYTRTSQSPLADANWAKANADMVVALGKQTDTYPRRLTVHVAGPTATTVDANHPGVGFATVAGNYRFDVTFDGTAYRLQVISIEHQIDTDNGWRCTFGFASLDRIATAYGAAAVFRLGSSALGGSDILGP